MERKIIESFKRGYMNYLSFDMNGIDSKELSAKLLFDIATARNSGFSLVKFILAKDADEKIKKALVSRLRDAKKRGMITFFASALDFDKGTTEVEYLLNKYPSLKEENDGTASLFVKL